MGNKQFAPALADQKSFFALDFSSSFMSDELYLINCVDEVESILISSMERQSVLDLSSKKHVSNYVLKLKFLGRPFSKQSSSSHVLCMERFLCTILEDFLRHGWIMKASSNLHRSNKRATLFFQRDEHFHKPIPKSTIVALSANCSDNLYLQNGDSRLCDIVKSQINHYWYPGIQKLKQFSDGEFKVKIRGKPWRSEKTDEALSASRLLILDIIKRFDDAGLSVYGTAHPESTEEAVDTIYFRGRGQMKPLGDIFMLGLLKNTKIYLVNPSADAVEIVRHCIKSVWDYGIEREDKFGNTVVFKLVGDPWSAVKRRGMRARFLMVRIFEDLGSVGWRILCTLDLCYNVDDVSCFVMHKVKPSPVSCMALSFHHTDRLRLINTPPDTMKKFRSEMALMHLGDCVEYEYKDCPEIVLAADMSSCIPVFCTILDRMNSIGWDLVSSADLSAKYMSTDGNSYPDDLHTWIFQRCINVADESTKGACGGGGGSFKGPSNLRKI